MKKLIVQWMEKFGIPTKGLGFNFIKNTGFITISSFIEQIFSYMIIVLISRFLGAEGLGQYSFIFAFAGFFLIFNDWGVSPLLIKNFSSGINKSKNYLFSVLSFKLFLSFVVFIVYILSLFFIGKDYLLWPLILAGLVTLISSLGSIPYSILRIEQKGFLLASSGVIERFISLILSFVFLFIYSNLTFFVLGLVISQLIRFIFLYLSSKEFFSDFRFNFSLSSFKNFFIDGFPFMLIGLFAVIYVQIDSIMLSFMKGDVVTGLYNAPYKLINILNVVPIILLSFGFPLFSKFYSENKKLAFLLLKKLSLFSSILILPFILLVFLFGDWALNFIYSFNSLDSFIVFKILIISELFVVLTTILGQFLSAIGKQKLFAKIGGFGAILNIVLNIILIPKFSLFGAAISTLITFLFMFIWMFFSTKRFL